MNLYCIRDNLSNMHFSFFLGYTDEEALRFADSILYDNLVSSKEANLDLLKDSCLLKIAVIDESNGQVTGEHSLISSLLPIYQKIVKGRGDNK